MKSGIIFLITIVFLFFGCKTNRQTEFTVLGVYSPTFFLLDEKLNGKVEKLTEKIYWGVADGENVRKGQLITAKEADSLGWGHIGELNYDAEGNLVSLKNYNENNEYIGGWQFFVKNNRIDSAQRILHDSVRVYHKFKYNKHGDFTEVSEFDADTDTLKFSWIRTISRNNDTVEYKGYDNNGNLAWKLLHLFNKSGYFTGYEYYYPTTTLNGTSRITYNDKNVASEIAFFDKDKKSTGLMKRTYEYDSKGNWVRMISRNDKDKINIHERTITYFK